jgi:hypothetical protein
MARQSLTLHMQKRWFFWPAIVALAALGKLGLIRDKPSEEHHGGIETGQERAARWLADHAIRIEVR